MPAPTGLRLPWTLDLGGPDRAPGLLRGTPRTALDLEEACADAQAGPADRPWMLTGGEPTLRPDLPRLLAALAPLAPHGLWMHTDAAALQQPGVARALGQAGLLGIWGAVHAPAADAHDWLAGARGSLRHTLRGLRAARAAGLEVGIRHTLTRPTVPLLPELVTLARRLQINRLWLHRPATHALPPHQVIALSPRLGLLGPLQRATTQAHDLGIAVQITGWSPDGPLPRDYAAVFGHAEGPAPRPQAQVRVQIDPAEPARAARARIIRASAARPRDLVLIDVGAHPQGIDMVRDALWMGLDRVSLWGWLDGWPPIDTPTRLRLAGLHAVHATLAHPDPATHDAQRHPGSHAQTLATLAALGRPGGTLPRGSEGGLGPGYPGGSLPSPDPQP